MSAAKSPRRPSRWLTNWCSMMTTNKILQREQSRPPKVISYQYCVGSIPISQLVCGTFKKNHSHFTPSPSETTQNVNQLKTKPEVVRYLHAAAGLPTKATWYAAVQPGNYNSWPWLNPKNMRAHFPESEETRKGHMRNICQGLRSTKKRVEPVEEVDSPPRQTKKHQDVFMFVFDLQKQMHSKSTMRWRPKFTQIRQVNSQYYQVKGMSISWSYSTWTVRTQTWSPWRTDTCLKLSWPTRFW